MVASLQKRNRILFATILAILGVCVGVASMLVLQQQEDVLLNSLMRKTEREVDLIGLALTDAMLRNDYSEGRRLLTDWRNNHPDVAHLEVTFENGMVFFAHTDDPARGTVLSTHTKPFTYADRTIHVTLSHRSAEMTQTLNQLRRNLFGMSAFLVLMVGTVLWFVLFRWMITPMEREIAQRTRDLQLINDTLEDQVRERTETLTQEIHVRQEIETTLRKLVSAVEQSPVLIFITDIDGTIEYVNPKFVDVTGYTRDEAVGQKPSIIKSPTTPPEVHRDLWDTILSGQEWTCKIEDRCKDGSVFWAHVHISPIRDENGQITHFIALHEDITERKAAEEAMKAARRAAELSNKAKTDLMANMSHELRTPLNAIIGFSETMIHGVFGPLGSPQYYEYADHIHTSGSHLLQLINDILDVSSVEAGKLRLREEPTNVAETCQVAVRILAPKAQAGSVTLKGIEAPELPLLMADPLRLKQIFINLVSNAVKFTPEGGSVSCSAALDEHGAMVITVHDTGIGMDEEDQAKALEKFGQVDSSLSRRHEGTGLGLPLSKGLVELHGGTLEIDSAPGQGTTVIIRFPAQRVLKDRTKQPGKPPHQSD